MINSPLHPLLGGSFAVITVTGRKTGRAISTPINVSPEGDGYTVISMRDRTWWRNLRGDAPATLRFRGKTFTVCGEITDDAGKVRETLKQYFQKNPGYHKYYNVRLTAAGEFEPEDLQRAADQRLIIHLRPA